VVVRLALGGQVVSVSENVVRVVSKKEFKEFGKILNKDSYEKYRDKQKEKEQEWNRERSRRDENRESDRKKSRSRSRSPDKSKRDSSRRRSRSRSVEKKPRDSRNGSSKPTWVRPMLRVRIVDKNFKSGKYFNAKVIVEDVSSNEICVVRLDSGSILDNVPNSKVETIIPKNDDSVVMIVRGSSRGQLGEILSRDKRSSRATVQVLPDKMEVLKLDYDDICEYVGDVSHL
jgi:G patch domain and KOW motifs-containing protein